MKSRITLRKITLIIFLIGATFCSNAQIISTIAGDGTGGYSGDGGQATSAELNNPIGLFYNSSGNIYVADFANSRVRKINSSGVISTIAGTGTAGYNGDNIQATSAEINQPASVFVDVSGNIYISDYNNNRIRKINTSGIITTVAGNGSIGYGGDGGPATSATLYYPQGVTVDASGNIYFSDCGSHIIREVNTSGIINTIAGVPGVGAYNGDGIAATSADLYKPGNAVADGLGNIYISDAFNNRIRKINSSGIISTVAGNGTAGFSGDGGQATSAELHSPWRITLDGGNIYINDGSNYRIREINISSGIITTVAGNGTAGFSGDGGQATSSELNIGDNEISMDASGDLFIADVGNQRIRKVSAAVSSPCVPNITTGLVAEYTFSGNANDVSGNGNNGTVYNATLTKDRFNNPNSAYFFNGVNAYIDVPNNASLNFSISNAMSISFWAVMDTTTVLGYSQVLVSKQSGSGNSQTGYDIEQYGGSSFYDGLRVGTSGGPYGGGATTNTPSLKQWHHYVFTYDGTGGISTGYVDGIIEDSVAGSAAVIGSDTYDLLFGEANWSNINSAPFYGVLDDIYMYDRLLTTCDVDSLYHLPNPNLSSLSSILENNINIGIYPNPTSGSITLTGVNSGQIIELYNIMGQKVIQNIIGKPTVQLDLSKLPDGIYLAKILTTNGEVVAQMKIVKMK